MRPSLWRQRILFIVVISVVFVTVPLVLLFFAPHDLVPSIAQRKPIDGEISRIVKSLPPNRAMKLEAEQPQFRNYDVKTGEGLKEPPGDVVLMDKEYVHNASMGIPNGTESGGSERSESKDVDGRRLEFGRHNASVSADRERHKLTTGTTVGHLIEHTGPRSVTNIKINEMQNQLIMAKVYLIFTPPNSNSHLVRELKLRIKEIERVLAHTRNDSDLSRIALQRMRAMGTTLAKANKIYPDCDAEIPKLRALTHATEEQLRAQKNANSYLIQLAARTFPKGLHCLCMRLTTEYFNLQPEEREFPNRQKVQKPDLYHYAIFSDNVLACAVVVNSTISNSMEPEKIVFHVVTDSLNFPAMMMWFLINRPGQATIHIESLDDLKWLPANYSSMYQQPGVKDPRYTSALNHLRFSLPEIFPYLNKVLLLDHDVVVQKDLRELWSIDMKGNANGAVERCREGDSSNRLDTLVDFSDPFIAKSFDDRACVWAYGMNMFDLMEWRRLGLTSVHRKFLRMGRRHQSWKAGSLPLGQLTFYDHTVALDRRWHVFGLGYNPDVGYGEVERAAVIHYDGNRKPWLETGISKYRGYWNKFLKYDHPYLLECNIHE